MNALSILCSLAEDLGISMSRHNALRRQGSPDAYMRGLRRGYVHGRRNSLLFVLMNVPQSERRAIGMAFRNGLSTGER